MIYSAGFAALSSSCFFNSCNLCSSCNFAALSQPILVNPVPAGINLPTITFSFNPSRLSTFPFIEASVKTRVVSWKDAAEINELVCNDAFVIPNRTLSNCAGFFEAFLNSSLILLICIKSITSPNKNLSHLDLLFQLFLTFV